jgi:hypothetical protein
MCLYLLSLTKLDCGLNYLLALLQVSVARVKFLQVMFLLPTVITTNAYYSWNEVRTLLLIYLDGFADFSQFYDAIAP